MTYHQPPEQAAQVSHGFQQAAEYLMTLLQAPGSEWTAGEIMNDVCAPFGTWVAAYDQQHAWPPEPAVRYCLQERLDNVAAFLAIEYDEKLHFVVPITLLVKGASFPDAAAAVGKQLGAGSKKVARHACTRYWTLESKRPQLDDGLWPVGVFIEVLAGELEDAYKSMVQMVSPVFGTPSVDWEFGNKGGQIWSHGTLASLSCPDLPVQCLPGPQALAGGGLLPQRWR